MLDANSAPSAARPGQVQIDRPRADVAAAGQRDHSPAPPRHERPQHAEAGPHPPHQSYSARGRSGIDVSIRSVPSSTAFDLDPQLAQQQCQRVDVDDVGNAFEHHGPSARIEAAMIGSAAFFDPLGRHATVAAERRR